MKTLVLPTLGLCGAYLALVGCQTVCDQDSDCTGEQTCFLNRCTNPATKNPANFGDGCEPGARQCIITATPEGVRHVVEACGIDEAGESRWAQAEICEEDLYCDDELGACATPTAPNAACTQAPNAPPCASGYKCSSVPDLSPVCLPICRDGRDCDGGEICAYGTCIPAGLCAGCQRGARRCASATPQVCFIADGECTAWRDEMICGGSDRCEAGACVGTVPEGGACAPNASCLPGLVCLDDAAVCTLACADQASCGGQRCLVTPGSQLQGVCVDGGGVAVDVSCVVVVESAIARGQWDQFALPGRGPADLFVALTGPDYSFSTGVVEDSEEAVFDTTSTPLDFSTLVQLDVVVLDSDFQGVDSVGRWPIHEGFNWSTGSNWSVAFGDNDRAVRLRVECSP